MKNKVLLIGNDINNATEHYSWNNLITGLLEYAKMHKSVNVENKPFPLLYEEIYLKSYQAHQTSEIRIKSYIASQTRKLNPNSLHRQILDLGIENILTTNYDLLFESSEHLDKIKCTNKGFIKESLYSLFRYHQTENHKIWHIHGTETSPKTITLGYEQYSGYLQQMRNYVVNGTKGTYKKRDFSPLSLRIKENTILFESWIDYFFTHDIYILGLNMDFVEMHLWWLLTYRARAKMEGRISIENTITYFYPAQFEESSKHKLEMFSCLGVTTKSISMTNDNRIDYYERIINEIRNEA